MDRELECPQEALDFYHHVVIGHNLKMQPMLLEILQRWRVELVAHGHTGLVVIDMGSRGFTWKNPTNYPKSDFEIAVYPSLVTDPVDASRMLLAAAYQMMSILVQQGYQPKFSITRAGLPYIAVDNYAYDAIGDVRNKFEICFQTREQNLMIRANYLAHVGPCEHPLALKRETLKKVAAYIWHISRAADNPDQTEYNRLKEWLRVIPTAKPATTTPAAGEASSSSA